MKIIYVLRIIRWIIVSIILAVCFLAILFKDTTIGLSLIIIFLVVFSKIKQVRKKSLQAVAYYSINVISLLQFYLTKKIPNEELCRIIIDRYMKDKDYLWGLNIKWEIYGNGNFARLKICKINSNEVIYDQHESDYHKARNLRHPILEFHIKDYLSPEEYKALLRSGT